MSTTTVRLRPTPRPGVLHRLVRCMGALALSLPMLLPGAPARAASDCALDPVFYPLIQRINRDEASDAVGPCTESSWQDTGGNTLQWAAKGALHASPDGVLSFTSHYSTWTLNGGELRLVSNTIDGAHTHNDRLGFAPGINYLFLLEAASGAYDPAPDGLTGTITLTAPDSNIQWFSDRPERLAGHRPLSTFLDYWDRLGFAQSAPNAAISLPNGSPEQDTMIFTMGKPRWESSTSSLSFVATRLDDVQPGRLQAQAARADGGLPSTFRSAVLFIDNAGDVADVIGNVWTITEGIALMAMCGTSVIIPGEFYNGCDRQDLRGKDMTGGKVGGGPCGVFGCKGVATPQFQDANLEGANLDGTGPGGRAGQFQRANLTNAKLTNGNWQGSQFVGANLRGTNFGHSNLTSANFTNTTLDGNNFEGSALVGAQFSPGATIRNVSFAGVDLRSANFNGVTLENVDFTGANLTAAQFVNATLNGVKFNKARLTSVNFTRANLSNFDYHEGYYCGPPLVWTNGVITCGDGPLL